MLKLANKGHSIIKMYGGNQIQSTPNTSSTTLTTTLTTSSTVENNQLIPDSIKNDNTPHTPIKGSNNDNNNNSDQEKLGGQISPINNVTNTISKGIHLFADSTVATCFFRFNNSCYYYSFVVSF